MFTGFDFSKDSVVVLSSVCEPVKTKLIGRYSDYLK